MSVCYLGKIEGCVCVLLRDSQSIKEVMVGGAAPGAAVDPALGGWTR